MEYFLAVNREALFHFGTPTSRDIMAQVYANQNRELYAPHPSVCRTDLQPRTDEEQ